MTMRNWTRTLLGVTAATLLAVPQAAQADWFGHKEELQIEESIVLDDVKGLDVLFRVGELHIENGPDGVIEIEGAIAIKSHNRERMERALAELELEIEENAKIISITLPESGYGKDYEIDLTIRVPRDLELYIEMNVGELTADIEVPAKAHFDLDVGELAIELPSGTAARVNASVSIGDVEVSGFDDRSGESKRKHLLGARFQGTLGDAEMADAHRLTAQVHVGEVSLEGRS